MICNGRDAATDYMKLIAQPIELDMQVVNDFSVLGERFAALVERVGHGSSPLLAARKNI